MDRLAVRWLPPARIMHPWPDPYASTLAPEAGAQCGSPARWDLCGGPPARAVPTAIAGIRGSRGVRFPPSTHPASRAHARLRSAVPDEMIWMLWPA